MPDLDDFEPLARQWKSLCSNYVGSDVSAYAIADEAIRVANAMLRRCGGCPILPELAEALEHYNGAIQAEKLGRKPSRHADAQLNQSLDTLARSVSNERISTIAIRSTKIIALQLHEGAATLSGSNNLDVHLASQIIKDLIGHCFLDTARAYAVGNRFSTSAKSQAFYDTVMQRIDFVTPTLGKRLAQDPTGKSLERLLTVPKQTVTPTLYDKVYRLNA